MHARFKLAPLAAVTCAVALPATAAASPYNAAVLSDGPGLYWQLDEASGTAVDNAATTDGLGDGTASSSAALGGAAAFPLSPFGAALAGSSAITTSTPSSAMAVELWVKPASAGSGTFLSAPGSVELGYNAKRKLTLSVAGGAPKDTRVGLPLNRWTLVDVSLNTGSGDDAQVYTNGGTWRVKTVRNIGVAPSAAPASLTLGGAIGGVDELAIFPAAVSQARAYSHFVQTGLPLSTALPSIAGTPRPGQTLTATPGAWSNATSTGLQWQRCDTADPATNACDDIAGATGASYVVQDADLGSYLSVTESAVNANGAASIDSVAVGPVSTTSVVIDPGTETDPGTGTTPGTGTGTGTTPGTGGTLTASVTGTPVATTSCAARRLLSVKAKRVRVKGAGRLTVTVARRHGGKVAVVARAAKTTKQRLAKVVFRLDRKTLRAPKGARLRRSFRLARLTAGKHALQLRVRPRHGKPRTVKLTLRITGC